MIASILPLEVGYKAALQVKKNIDDGIRYVYYLHGNPDDAQKICRLLQMMLLAPMLDTNKPIGYRYLQSEVKQNKNRIVQDLEQICARESLKIFFLPGSPELEYLIYNADSVDKAVLYFKHGDKFMQWETGENAHRFWAEVRQEQGISSGEPHAIFLGASGFNVREDAFYRTLKYEIARYFPGIDEKVAKLCFDGTL